MLRRASSLGKPRPPVELAWGSQSIRRVGRPSRAMAAARLMAVVVLPTPPFWLTTAMTLDEAGADVGLVSGYEVIIGVRRRVSGGGTGGNADELCRSVGRLWRIREKLVFRGNLREFQERGVEIFCSAWNISGGEVGGVSRTG